MNINTNSYISLFCRNSILLVITICGLIPSRIIAQPKNIKFEQIGLEQGLSQSTVYAITQDKYGFMWFGTQDGLNRYDGYSIKVYKYNPNDSNSISMDRINVLLSDSKGDLWIGTSGGGVNKYILSENKFYHYVNNHTDSLSISDNSINSIFEDSKGNIWIGTNQGLNKYKRERNSFIRYYFNQKKTLQPNGNTITAICEDLDENIWVGTFNGLFKLNLNNSSGFNKVNNLNIYTSKMKGDNVTSLYINHSGLLLIGTFDGGLKCYDKERNTFDLLYTNENAIKTIYEDLKGNFWIGTPYSGLKVLKFSESKSPFHKPQVVLFKEYLANILYEDNSGILWIGTYTRGVLINDRKKNHFKYYLNNPQNPNSVVSILEDRNGDIWAGTMGNGLKHIYRNIDTSQSYWINRKILSTINSDKIFDLCETSDGRFWIGTIGDGLYCFNKSNGNMEHYLHHSDIGNKGLLNNDITELFEDRRGNLWIGYITGDISVLDVKKKYFSHYYSEDNNTSGTVIREDKKGTVWVGTLSGLKYFIPKSDSFVTRSINLKSNDRYNPSVRILSLYIQGNILWIGSSRSGLVQFDPSTNSSTFYSERDGLLNNTINGILPDESGNLWLSTNKGLSRFCPKNKKFKNFDINDGLQSNEFNQGSYFLGKNGEIFFGGINGLNSFFPKDIEDNNYIPPVYLTTFQIFNKTVDLSNPIIDKSKIELSYSQNFISFEFVALNYTSPEKNQYAYKLEGFDSDWHFVPSQQRYASYSNLDPGKYLLRVKGSNNDGEWNESGTSVIIIVKPPFWKTWWFTSLIVILILGSVSGAIRYFVTKKIRDKTSKLKQETALEREKLRIARDMHDDLGAKVTQISIICELAKKDMSREKSTAGYIEEISSIVHRVVQALDGIVWVVNPKNDTLEHLIDYLIEYIEQFLSQTSISYRLDIPEDIPNFLVLSDVRHNLFMIVQEALNNTVKHAQATEIHVKMTARDSKFSISLKDNGCGISDMNRDKKHIKEFSNGLSNMEKRMEDIGGRFTLNSVPETGTEIHLEIAL